MDSPSRGWEDVPASGPYGSYGTGVGAVLPNCKHGDGLPAFALLGGRERDELVVAKPDRPGSATGRQEPLEAVVRTDHEGRVTAWSEAAAKMTGLSAEEIIGQPAWEICTRILPAGRDPDAVGQRVRTMVDMALTNGRAWEPRRSIVRLRHLDGVTKVIEHDMSVEQDGDGYRLVVTPRDVTPPKPAAKSSGKTGYHRLFIEDLSGIALHKMIFDEMGAPIDYRFVDVNPAFEAMTGSSVPTSSGGPRWRSCPGWNPNGSSDTGE